MSSNEKVDALLANCSDFYLHDFVDLAVEAADQTGQFGPNQMDLFIRLLNGDDGVVIKERGLWE